MEFTFGYSVANVFFLFYQTFANLFFDLFLILSLANLNLELFYTISLFSIIFFYFYQSNQIYFPIV